MGRQGEGGSNGQLTERGRQGEGEADGCSADDPGGPGRREIEPRSQELLDKIVALMLCPFGP